MAVELRRIEGLKASHTRRTIYDLPDDVLCEIFLLYAKDCRQQYEESHWGDFKQWPYVWTRVALVCRRWRTVALGYTALWTWVVPIRAEATRTFLQRSGQRRLTIVYHRDEDVDTQQRVDREPQYDHNGYCTNYDDGRKRPALHPGIHHVFSHLARIERQIGRAHV